MDPANAIALERDFSEIFEQWEACTLPLETMWCRPLLIPPNCRNTRANRAIVETVVNCLLIGKFKCRYTPRIQLGWTGRGYLIGVDMTQAIHHTVSLVEPPEECSEQSTNAHA